MYSVEDLFDKRDAVGPRLEQIIKQKGYTKIMVCQDIGISRPTLDKILWGRLTSKTNFVKHTAKILNYLNLTPDSLLGEILNKRIRANRIRKKLRISAKELSNFSGLSIDRIKQIESGERASIAELRDIAFFLGTSVRSLLDRSCFDTQISVNASNFAAYDANGLDADPSRFWGHLGILPNNSTEFYWFPITGYTKKSIYDTMFDNRIVVPCMNNKVVLLNSRNIKQIVFWGRDCSPPQYANWNSSISSKDLPLAFYEALYDSLSPDHQLSTNTLSDRLKRKILDFLDIAGKDEIQKMLFESRIIHNDRYVVREEIDFGKAEDISTEIHRILTYGDATKGPKRLFCSLKSGPEVVLELNRISFLEVPLLLIEKKICEEIERIELFSEESNAFLRHFLDIDN